MTTIARLSDSPFSGLRALALNASGTIAFNGTRDSGNQGINRDEHGIFTSTGGVTTAVALSSGPIFNTFPGPVSINTPGAVAFLTSLDDAGLALYIVKDGTATPVLRTEDAFDGSKVQNLAFGYNGSTISDSSPFATNLKTGGPVLRWRARSLSPAPPSSGWPSS